MIIEIISNLFHTGAFRNLRYSYNEDSSKLDNIHYHEFDEDTSWKLYIPLVRSGGYLLTPNPGEGVKEDMNSQLDLLHMDDQEVWSLTKVNQWVDEIITTFVAYDDYFVTIVSMVRSILKCNF